LLREETVEKIDQLGLISYLAEKIGPTNKLGRKAVQKFIHIATELGKVPTGYRFSFYTYGPYSRELAADLEYAEAIDGISSCQDSNTGAFDIKAGVASNAIIKNAKVYLDNNTERLDLIFKEFGGFSARLLELYSTIIFVKAEEPAIANSIADLKNRIKKLKPKYSDGEFDQAIDLLKRVAPKFN
jgi:uncharacterized protein